MIGRGIKSESIPHSLAIHSFATYFRDCGCDQPAKIAKPDSKYAIESFDMPAAGGGTHCMRPDRTKEGAGSIASSKP